MSVRRLALLSCCLMSLVLTSSVVEHACGEDVSFQPHIINADSTYSACAAIDVNHDGKLDVVCGGWWYEAPNWKRHFLREVQQIRGRFDGYSHLPMDVNGDGWLDFISCNYRSRAIYWLEHPGASLGTWTKHIIDTPGSMETGRLHDIDGDGRLDILPNGTKFAAWWELASKKGAPQWLRHELPNEVAGHGVGFGDIDGDGRGDLVGPRGWLQAPQDRRKGRWVWRPEFRLHRDCSIPILVHDVDNDGDNDVIWGRGHRFGLYWLEQRGKGEDRSWRQHTIDSSWSQPHSLLLADLDNDGHDELFAGKRYMGHDGKDPGEYDRLVSFYYKFDKERRSWRRSPVSSDVRLGFGLDPKAVDLDSDGDLDLVASGRSGLYWLENRPGRTDDDAAAKTRRKYDHARLLYYIDEEGRRKTVTTPAEWALRREAILGGMEQAMGALPDPSQRVPLDVELISETEFPKYTQREIRFTSEPGDRVPALLLVPKGEPASRMPAMLCLHQTTRIGKGEPAGLGGKPNLRYAAELASRGYVCLAPDYPSFGDYAFDFKRQAAHYQSGSMKAIWNNLRAVDLLEATPNVDPDRIGCIGHSLGGHNALFTAAFDQRLSVVVTSCGFTAFHHYYGGKLAGWTSDRYMPLIRERYHNDPDQTPFDFYEVLGAIAPRSILVNAPLSDGNFEVQGVKKTVAEAKRVFELLGKPEALHAVYPAAGHDFPTSIREAFYERIDKQMRHKPPAK